jgi:hypothetical protein
MSAKGRLSNYLSMAPPWGLPVLWMMVRLAGAFVVLGYVAYTARYCDMMAKLFSKMADETFLGYCGNVVTDPLCFLLNAGTTVSAILVGTLAVHGSTSRVSRWMALILGSMMIAATFTLVWFGSSYYRYELDGLKLSQDVWWLWPLGWFGL